MLTFYFLITERLLSSDNDSAKPLSLIASIYRYLMLYFGQDNDLVTARAKMVQSMKKALENPVSVPKSVFTIS